MDRLPDGNAEQYVPTPSQEDNEQVLRSHERAYREGRAEGRSDETFSYLGTQVVV